MKHSDDGEQGHEWTRQGSNGKRFLTCGLSPCALLLAILLAEPAFSETPARPEESPEAAWILTGKVVDEETGRPIEEARVWVSGNEEEAVRSDAKGRFKGAFHTPYRGSDLVAAATGYLTAGAPVAPLAHGVSRLPWEEAGRSDSGTTGIRITLSRVATLQGVVVDSEGGAVPAVEIDLALEISATPTLGLAFRRGYRWIREAFATRTDAHGRFRMSDVPPGAAYLLRLRKPGFAPLDVPLEALAAGERRVAMRLVFTKGRTAVGHIVGPEGEAVAGADLWLWREGSETRKRILGEKRIEPKEEPTRVSAGPEGSFSIPFLPPGRHTLEAAAEGFAPAVLRGLEVAPGEGAADLGVIRLGAPATLTGRVVDQQGEPILGVEATTRLSNGSRREVLRQAKTDASGEFALAGLIPGSQIVIRFSKAGWLSKPVPVVSVPDTAPPEFVLERAARVSGRVILEDGKPASWAKITLTLSSGRRVHFDDLDDQGRFDLDAVPPGRVTLLVSTRGYPSPPPLDLDVEGGGHISGVEFVLRRGTEIQGQVFAGDGLPLEGARVCARPQGARDGSPRERCGDSHDGGRFRINGVGPGAHHLVASHNGYAQAATQALEVREERHTVDLELPSGTEFGGLVTDEEDRPLAGAEMTLKVSSGKKLETRSAADGSFLYRGLPKGFGWLSAEKRGYSPVHREGPFIIGEDPVYDYLLRLGRGASVSGRILGFEQDELAALQVSARRNSFGKPSYGGVDHQGRYGILHLTPGKWFVTAVNRSLGKEARSEIVIEAEDSEVNLDLEFKEGFTLSGVVMRDGAPVRGLHVSLSCSEHHGLMQPRDQTREDGSFAMGGLEPGRCWLSLKDDKPGFSRGEGLEITGDRELRIAFDTASVSGKVRSSDSRPLAGVSFRLTQRAGADVSYSLYGDVLSDAQGAFRFDAVPEGTWEFKVTKPGYENRSIPLEVRSGEPIEDLLIEMNESRRLSARVRLGSGRVPERVSLVFLDSSGESLGSGFHETGEDGAIAVPLEFAEATEILIGNQFGSSAALLIPASGDLGVVRLESTGKLAVGVPDLLGSRVPATVALIGPDGKLYDVLGRPADSPRKLSGFKGILFLGNLKPGPWQVTVTTEDGRSWSATATVVAEEVVDVTLHEK